MSRGGRDARVPNELVTFCSRCAATSKSSRIRRSSRSRPASAGPSSANERFLFPQLDARLSSISSSASARRCPWTAAYFSSSSASPSPRCKGDPKARLEARGGGDVARVLVDELVDPKLEGPPPTAFVTLITPLCDIRLSMSRRYRRAWDAIQTV